MEHTLESVRDEVFCLAYQLLSELGACDAPGGTEFVRVHAAWVDAGRPVGMVDFIRRAANVSPIPQVEEEPDMPYAGQSPLLEIVEDDE